jgi:hypothetical protein
MPRVLVPKIGSWTLYYTNLYQIYRRNGPVLEHSTPKGSFAMPRVLVPKVPLSSVELNYLKQSTILAISLIFVPGLSCSRASVLTEPVARDAKRLLLDAARARPEGTSNGQFPKHGHLTTQICTKFTTCLKPLAAVARDAKRLIRNAARPRPEGTSNG